MTSKISKQQENISNLLALISENPELRIMPIVNTEIVASDDYKWWVAGWGTSRIDEITGDGNDECFHYRSEEDELVEQVVDNLSFDDEHKHRTEEELEQIAQLEVHNYNWEKVILVNITLP